MQQAWARRLLCWIWVVGLSLASVGWASDPPALPQTVRILDRIEQSRNKRTPADMEAARSLNAQGDRAYRKRNYSAAFSAYSNSYPNHPNAYAYIMTGDAYWRRVVQSLEAEAHSSVSGQPACSEDNNNFAGALALDVAQHHEVGLALAVRENDRRLMQSTLYRRARESATCLQSMARQYEAKPRSACVDVAQLRSCLGIPLIK